MLHIAVCNNSQCVFSNLSELHSSENNGEVLLRSIFLFSVFWSQQYCLGMRIHERCLRLCREHSLATVEQFFGNRLFSSPCDASVPFLAIGPVWGVVIQQTFQSLNKKLLYAG